jgi:hypothetical protein
MSAGSVLACLTKTSLFPNFLRNELEPMCLCTDITDCVLWLQALSLPTYESFDKLGIDDVGARDALKEVGSCSHALTMFDHGLTMPKM